MVGRIFARQLFLEQQWVGDGKVALEGWRTSLGRDKTFGTGYSCDNQEGIPTQPEFWGHGWKEPE